jgi:hypothetical protein
MGCSPHPPRADSRPHVTRRYGVVTLRNVAERDSVTRLAGEVEGVLRVVNRMTLAVPGAERPQ